MNYYQYYNATIYRSLSLSSITVIVDAIIYRSWSLSCLRGSSGGMPPSSSSSLPCYQVYVLLLFVLSSLSKSSSLSSSSLCQHRSSGMSSSESSVYSPSYEKALKISRQRGGGASPRRCFTYNFRFLFFGWRQARNRPSKSPYTLQR